MKQLKKDMVLYIILVIISLLFYFVAIPQQIPLRSSWSGDITFTSRTFPYLLFFVMGVAALIGIVQTVIKIRRVTQPEEQQGIKDILQNILLPVYFFLLAIGYAMMFDRFGYAIATAIMIPVYLVSLKCKKWYYYAITYGVGITVFVVFKFLLNIPL